MEIVDALPACMSVYSAPKWRHWKPYTGPRSPFSLPNQHMPLRTWHGFGVLAE